MESEAVLTIIDRCDGDWAFFKSDVLFDEISMLTNVLKKQKILLLYQAASLYVELTEEMTARAKELECMGIKPYDALHVASAEYGKADIFLTTDRRLINAAGRARAKVEVKNPLRWLLEVLYER
jgi:predicted nucleic acid-binding protein